MTAERIDYTTGEVVATMTEPEARRATERIRTALDRVSTAWQDLAERVADAYSRRADLALGYGSWAEYTQAEFNVPTLATEVRRELVSLLSAQGMSTRAIAPVVGVTHKTIILDRQVVPEVTPDREPAWPPVAKPDPAAMPTQNASTMRVNPAVSSATTATPGPSATAPTAPAPRPAAVTGLDGKTYTRPEPAPRVPREPARRPLRDGFRDASLDLGKVVDRFERLVADDRYPRNRDEVARYANDLIRAREALDRLIGQMSNTN